MNAARVIVMGTALAWSAQVGTVARGGAPEEFQAWFHDAARGTLRIPAEVERRARGFRYVFVGGFANERMPGYFAQCEKELKARGVPGGAIHTIFPSSHRSFEENSEEVGARFRQVAELGPERLVVIAHSRGACDTLAFAMGNGPFVRDRVRAMFLVQGAFGGTGAADYLMGEGLQTDRRMPARLRLLAYALGGFERFLMRRGKHGGLAGLTHAESERFWRRLREDHADAVAVVGPRTFYVTSRVSPDRLRLFRRAVGAYLQTYYGPNDGMVALSDQSLPGLGTVLAVLDAGHSDLTHRPPATRAPRRLRKALVRSVLMAVGSGAGRDAFPGMDSGGPDRMDGRFPRASFRKARGRR